MDGILINGAVARAGDPAAIAAAFTIPSTLERAAFLSGPRLVMLPFGAESGRSSHEARSRYPIVDDAEWLRRLLPVGVRMVQLRIKNVRR